MNARITKFLVIIICCSYYSCSTPKSAQQSRIPEQNTNASRYETNETLRKKIASLEKQLVNSPDNADLLIQLAALYQEVGEADKALQKMELLQKLGFKEDPRLYGSMATLYIKKEEFAKAKASYVTFQSLLDSSSVTANKIKSEIKKLDFIIETLDNPYVINIRPFSSDLNTTNSEYLPQFTIDDSSLIFTRRFFDQEDLFIAYKTSTGYRTEAIEELNTLTNEGAHTLSSDGSLLIFTRCENKSGYGSCDLYRSTKNSLGKWSKPANMGKAINSRNWDAQPSLSADGKILFFSSKRDGGLGGSDIYASQMKNDGSWGMPRNLGSKINTKSNDEAPFIHSDGSTLYFRSTGHDRLGGYDLYMTQLKERRWTSPINLGSPINTTGEDGALVVSLDGTRGYYATNTYNNIQQDHLDLFEFDLPQEFRPQPMTFIKGRVIDEKSGFPIQAEITIKYLDKSNYQNVYTANYNGEFLAALPVGKPTLINIKSKGYVFYSDHVNYQEVRYSVDPYKLNIGLSKVSDITSTTEVPESIILNNIFFKTGSDVLLEASEAEIDILFNLLRDQENIHIVITGHTDNVGSDEANLTLSKNRAESVKMALINKGITGSRITTKGAGETQPIASNDTEEGRTKNRRTEFKISS